MAIDYTWNGSAGSAWDNTANWTSTGGTFPNAAGDTATIPLAASIALNGAKTVGALTLNGTTGTINVGNGVTTDSLFFDNTGGAANSDGNSNPSILSAGTATNVISAPVRIGNSGAATLQILQTSINSLNLSGGLRLDSTTAGGNNALAVINNLTGSATLDVGDVTSISTVTPTAGITNTIRFGNANNSTTTNWGTINLNGVISNGAQVGGFNVTTGVVYGAGAASNTNNSIATINIKGANTYSGATQLFRANIVLGTDTPFGTSTVQSGSGFQGNLTGANLFSDNDARTITNNFSLARNISFKGTNSLKLAMVNGFVSSNTIFVFNMISPNKTLTLGAPTSFVSTATTDAGRILTFDGSGTTIIDGKIINNLGSTSLTAVPTDAGTEGRISKAGLGLLKITNSANTFKAYAAASGGIMEFTNAGATSSAWMALNPGGAIGVDTGSLAIVPARLAASNVAANQVNKGSIALATADATTDINYVTDTNLSTAQAIQTSIGALPGGVTYTGTITPAASTYRLGGGDVLTLPNNNALAGCAAWSPRTAARSR
ncbi:MAG: hypothetical protein QM770_18395 [Tepidisphaeraceae bacterium]